MALEAGTRLGSFEIVGSLGAGGMGEVYRAKDLKLGREVAIKTLPVTFAADKDRLARFEREAKLLASLSHAHIAAVHSLDEQDGALYIAMELVEGESLEQMLRRGPLPVEHALQLALQIAEALEAAHAKGVVHRDLKPANVMVTADGVIKVLDFGLAKAFSGVPSEASPAHSPALSLAMTQTGLVLGTAAYMSPEQASGQATDQRTDIWAFGALVYEMLTGLPLFAGDSVPHILADVLRSEPDWNRLPGKLHPRVRQMLERCLTKRLRDRYHAIADARVDIEAALADPEGSETPHASRRDASTRPLLVGVAAAAALTAAFAAVLVWRVWPEPPAQAVTRFVYDVPPGRTLTQTDGFPILAVSADGNTVFYVTDDGLGARKMANLEPLDVLSGVPAMYLPMVSPDGNAVAYVDSSSQELKVVAVSGGAPETLVTGVDRVFGGSWADDGRIFYALGDGVYSVQAAGGEPARVVETEAGRQAFGPELLPDGDSLLFSLATPGDWDGGEIVVHSLSSGVTHSLFAGGTSAHYLPTGHIVYALAEDLYAVPFDVDALRVTGPAQRVVEGVMRKMSLWESGAAQYAVSNTGTLAYRQSVPRSKSRVLWIDRSGHASDLGIEPRAYLSPSLSPDATRVVINELNVANDIWVWNLTTRTPARLSLGPEGGDSPAWSADGQRIAYHPSFGPFVDWRASNNAGVPSRLIDGGEDALDPFHPHVFDPLGRYLLIVGRATPATGWDLGMITLDDTPELSWLLRGPYDETQPSISSDGRWIAYASSESGRSEVYVRPFPNVDDDEIPVSRRGGLEPKWSADSNELFYIEPGAVPRLISIAVDTSGTEFRQGERQDLFEWQYALPVSPLSRSYDVAPDGQHFVAIESASDALPAPEIVVVQNWFEELETIVPAP